MRMSRSREAPAEPPHELRRRDGALGFLRILGPGLITGASDDDPSGIGTYSQVGSQFGFGLLWTALFTFPLMAAVQELCARIALETGVGLGVALRRKFPTWLVGACILALLLANTFNLGADLGAIAAGGSLLSGGRVPARWLIVPVALLILAFQMFTTYKTISRVFRWLALVLVAYVITAIFVRPPAAAVLRATFLPHLEASPAFISSLVAVLGTTISPYLFFWQASSEVDERRSRPAISGVRRPELAAARADVLIGMAASQIVMYAIILTSAAVLNAHGKTDVQTADQAANALAPVAGPFAFVLFSVGIIGTGLLAVPVLSGSAAYAVKEFLGLRGSLRDSPLHRPVFYGLIAASTLAGLAMNFLHLDPIRALFVAALVNGLVAPPVLVLVVLLGSDRRFMGARVSGTWSRALTWAATLLMSAAAVFLIATLVTPVLGRL
jgi:NRAMP (natural resistance-associated macrophage protein)-like metal ion transporter